MSPSVNSTAEGDHSQSFIAFIIHVLLYARHMKTASFLLLKFPNFETRFIKSINELVRMLISSEYRNSEKSCD
jgi:hypothetical protein